MGHWLSCLLPRAQGAHSNVQTQPPESNKISAQIPVTQSLVKRDVPETDYIFSELVSQTLERVPGSLPPGYPIAIENCTNSSLFILDFISQLSVDECSDCTLVLGPTEGSLFLRDCRDCTVICSAQQVRLRDCTKMHLFLFSSTEPVIETSSDVTFSNLHLSYTELKDHLIQAKLWGRDNKYDQIYDFNDASSRNYTVQNDPDSIQSIIDKLPVPSDAFIETTGFDTRYSQFIAKDQVKIEI